MNTKHPLDAKLLISSLSHLVSSWPCVTVTCRWQKWASHSTHVKSDGIFNCWHQLSLVQDVIMFYKISILERSHSKGKFLWHVFCFSEKNLLFLFKMYFHWKSNVLLFNENKANIYNNQKLETVWMFIYWWVKKQNVVYP